MSEGSERRHFERFELLAQVELRRDGHVEPLTVLNISAGGVLLRNDRNVDFTMGDMIRLHFDIPELGLAFSIDARVVRVVAATTKPAVLAAMWSSSDDASGAGLAQLLWSLSGSER
jgi:hypothetical protein